MKKINSLGWAVVAGLMPLLAFADAQSPDGGSSTADRCANYGIKNGSKLGDIFIWGSCTLLKTVVPFLFSLATAAFIWGVIQYYLNPDNEEKRKKGKSFMIGGIIALFVMVAMWGLVGILSSTFAVRNAVPQLPGE
jgi:hypothetical protein